MQDSEDSDDLYPNDNYHGSEEFDLQLIYKTIITRITYQKKTSQEQPFMDEFAFFCGNLRNLFNKNAGFEEVLRSKLQPQIREYLKILMQSKRVVIGEKANY